MKRDAWIASWEEEPQDGDAALDIYPYPANDGKPGTVAICVNDERFDAVTVATLDEILGHLTALRTQVFGAQPDTRSLRLLKAMMDCLEYLGLHRHELSERAVTALQFLEDAIEKDADETKEAE